MNARMTATRIFPTGSYYYSGLRARGTAGGAAA
jgi:hypothetical protein